MSLNKYYYHNIGEIQSITNGVGKIRARKKLSTPNVTYADCYLVNDIVDSNNNSEAIAYCCNFCGSNIKLNGKRFFNFLVFILK
mgnify:CR=1 FL=1|jgi:hypothetical protein